VSDRIKTKSRRIAMTDTPETAPPTEDTSLSPLLQLAEKAWSFVSDTLDQDGPGMPHFIAELPDGSIHFMATPWQGEDDKEIILNVVAKHFAEHGVVRYALTSEVWYVRREGGDPRTMGMPSEQPDRQSAQMVLAVDRSGEILNYMAEIIETTDDTGAPRRSLGERKVMPAAGQFGGRMTQLLGPLKRPPIH
jgi:hypothetical protein